MNNTQCLKSIFAVFCMLFLSLPAHAISGDDLIGSTWSCTYSDGDTYTLEFEPNGSLTSSTSGRTVGGTWKLNGKSIVMVINNFMTLTGVFANNKYMSGSAKSTQHSNSWKCKL